MLYIKHAHIKTANLVQGKIVLIQNFKIWMSFRLSIFALRFIYPDIVAKHGEKFTENMNRNLKKFALIVS